MESNTSFDDLPEVLVMDILSRLPVKSLLQLTAVRKVWYSIIKSVSFISLHLSRSVSDPSRYYIFIPNDFPCWFSEDIHRSCSFGVVSDNPLRTSPFPEHYFFPFPLSPTSRKRFIGACKGLVCLKDDRRDGETHGIYLINPFIRKYRELDVESSCYADLIGDMKDKNCIRIDIGYSEIEDDYKVLRIITPRVENHTTKVEIYDYKVLRIITPNENRVENHTTKVEIYGLKSGKWKSIDVSIKIKIPTYYGSAACVLGCLYWCIKEEHEYYLLCFDLKDEVFSKIELPTTLYTRPYHHIYNKNDSLVLVELYDGESIYSMYKKTKFCLLVLKNNFDGQVEWKKFSYECACIYRGVDPDTVMYPIVLNVLGFSVGGRLIFQMYPYGYCYQKSIVAVDLDNNCSITEFDSDDHWNFYGPADDWGATDICGSTSVLESLLLLSE